MNIIETYRQKYPDLHLEQLLQLIASEAFLRRMNGQYDPFMLKGSFVSRLYFPDDTMRLPADLDFVYLGNVKDAEKAESFFSEWADKITQTPANDYIKFERFSKHDSWQGVDYQMHQDFPTVQGEISARVVNQEVKISVDISFNLDLLSEPVDMLYPTPMDDIYLPYTVPLAVQVAWKIHQGIVEPRFKDFYDLAYLAPQLIQPDDIKLMLNTLKNECERDKIALEEIQKFFIYQDHQRLGQYYFHSLGKGKYLPASQNYDEQISRLKNYCPKIPTDFDDFWLLYQISMQESQFNEYLDKFNFK